MDLSSESSLKHKQEASNEGAVHISVVTVSDSRTENTDLNGKYLKKEITKAGHIPDGYKIVKDEPDLVQDVLEKLIKGKAKILIFNGGTGLSKRDRTFDVINSKLEKHMIGFGEIFRMLSYEQVGSAAMFSRAVAGVYHGKMVISIPGSHAAVQLAWEKLIRPEIEHMAWEINR